MPWIVHAIGVQAAAVQVTRPMKNEMKTETKTEMKTETMPMMLMMIKTCIINTDICKYI